MQNKVSASDILRLEVLASSDLHNKYLSCVPMFINFWLSTNLDPAIEIRPRVLIVANILPNLPFDYLQYCTLLDPGKAPTSFVAQVARLTEAPKSNADFVMTTDIDMLPLNQRVTKLCISKLLVNPKSFIIARDVLDAGQYPICYNLASPATWSQLLKTNAFDNPTPMEILAIYGGGSKYSGIHGGEGWTIDQEFLYSLVESSSSTISVIKLQDIETKHRRLDRVRHRFPRNWMVLPLILFGRYTDYHVHHPIQKYWIYTRVVKKIMQGRNLFRRKFV